MVKLSRDLRRVPLHEALARQHGTRFITMAEDQWDATLAEAYRAGWVLLEVDERERPVAAYRKAGSDAD
jgi:hypothetical protein